MIDRSVDVEEEPKLMGPELVDEAVPEEGVLKGPVLELSSPWCIYHSMIRAFYAKDPGVTVLDLEDTGDGTYHIQVQVKGVLKAQGIAKLLRGTKQFGNITVTTSVECVSSEQESWNELLQGAFGGNDRVADIREIADFAQTPHEFVIFNPEVLQFRADNTQSVNGLWSGLAEDIAREIFDGGWQTSFCTAPSGD